MSSSSPAQRFPLQVRQAICLELVGTPSYPDKSKVGPRTVAALARTCRLFHDCALDVLWYRIPNIALLFHILPREAYVVKRCQHPISKRYEVLYSFACPPSEECLKRFYAYARRVRVLNAVNCHLAQSFRLHVATPEAYDILASSLRSRPLLPNVEDIDFERGVVTPFTVFRSFHILFGPKLLSLKIMSWRREPRFARYARRAPTPEVELEHEEIFAAMVTELRWRSPKMESLILSIHPSGEHMASASSTALCGFDHLAVLSFGANCIPTQPDAFVHLASLPRLQQLKLTSHDSSWADADFLRLSESQVARFPALQGLCIGAPTLALPIKLLPFVGSPRLKGLQVSIKDVPTASDIQSVFTVIAGLKARDNISNVNVGLECDALKYPRKTGADTVSAASARMPEAISDETFEPLWALRNIKHLSLDVHCPLDIGDAFLDKVASTWPRIDSLQLDVRNPYGVLPTDARLDVASLSEQRERDRSEGATGWMPELTEWPRPRITLLGLLEFARRCPQATHLGINFDAGLHLIPPMRLETRPAEGMPSCVMDLLDVGLSPIEDPVAVAAILSDSFPGIDQLENGWAGVPMWGYKGDSEDGEGLDENGQNEGEGGNTENTEDGGPWLSDESCEEASVYCSRWDKVARLLPWFAHVRRQERRWKRAAGVGETEGSESDFSGHMDLSDLMWDSD